MNPSYSLLFLVFLLTLVMGAWVNDDTARHCMTTTGKTYQECNQ